MEIEKNCYVFQVDSQIVREKYDQDPNYLIDVLFISVLTISIFQIQRRFLENGLLKKTFLNGINAA